MSLTSLQVIRNYLGSLETIRSYVGQVAGVLENLPVDKIAETVALIESARDEGKKVIIFGNGGSAATASHFAADLSKGAICEGKPRIRSFALTESVPLMSAWANDMDYGSIFAQQLKNIVEEGDVVIGISGSGNSQNVVKAIETAKSKNAVTIAFTGFDGGKLIGLVDVVVLVHHNNMEQVEDAQLMIEHAVTTCLMRVS